MYAYIFCVLLPGSLFERERDILLFPLMLSITAGTLADKF